MKTEIIEIATLEQFQKFFVQDPFPKKLLSAGSFQFQFGVEAVKDLEALKETYINGLAWITDVSLIHKIRKVEANLKVDAEFVLELTEADCAILLQETLSKKLKATNLIATLALPRLEEQGKIEKSLKKDIGDMVRYWWRFLTAEHRLILREEVFEWARKQQAGFEEDFRRMCEACRWVNPEDDLKYVAEEMEKQGVNRMNQIIDNCLLDEKNYAYQDGKEILTQQALEAILLPDIISIIKHLGSDDSLEVAEKPKAKAFAAQG